MAGLQTAIHWQLQKTEEYLMFLVPIGFLDQEVGDSARLMTWPWRDLES